MDEVLARDPWPTAETWGADPASQRAQRAMMGLAGAPAPLRRPEGADG